jgi:hypothetical protein
MILSVLKDVGVNSSRDLVAQVREGIRAASRWQVAGSR